MSSSKNDIIAVDGYSSCGKSTFAKMIAGELGFVYIDSGAMYRAVALYCLEHDFISEEILDIERLQHSLEQIMISFKLNRQSKNQETWLDGKNVEQEIRSIPVSEVVSKISQVKEVRTKMVKMQRKIGSEHNVVMDGRDIGTVVFPNAKMKIFMTADTDVRAKRRYDELMQKGMQVSLDEIRENIKMRDHEDETRKESPLRKAVDALVLDNSNMTVEQQMEWFSQQWKKINS